MCHRFTMLNHDEVEDVVRALECGVSLGWKPDWPARAPHGDAFPGASVCIIARNESGDLALASAAWGFSAPWSKRPLFNTRIETALSSDGGIWSGAIAHGRCIVPAVRFFETKNRSVAEGIPAADRPAERRRSLYSFGMPDGEPVLLAGVQQEGCFSVVTTEPNESVSPVHDRMPLVLAWHEAWMWLGSDFASLADRSGLPLDVRAEEKSRLRVPNVSDNQMRLF
ncbi:MAG: SOS response-associated peptidase family protein [Slackia sp.]|nr:SOS response-associated peptidase family protein [Slackia sp.]